MERDLLPDAKPTGEAIDESPARIDKNMEPEIKPRRTRHRIIVHDNPQDYP